MLSEKCFSRKIFVLETCSLEMSSLKGKYLTMIWTHSYLYSVHSFNQNIFKKNRKVKKKNHCQYADHTRSNAIQLTMMWMLVDLWKLASVVDFRFSNKTKHYKIKEQKPIRNISEWKPRGVKMMFQYSQSQFVYFFFVEWNNIGIFRIIFAFIWKM